MNERQGFFLFLRRLLAVGAALGFSMQSARAQLPVQELESLRSDTVVARVALDTPHHSKVQACGVVQGLASMGAALALKTDNAIAHWKTLTLSATDLQTLDRAVSICESRGSCSVYRDFLAAVQVPASLRPQTLKLSQQLEKKLEKLSASSYLRAWQTVARPCHCLRGLR